MVVSPTTAAAPGWTDPQPASTNTVAAATRVRSFMAQTIPTVTLASGRRDEGVDDRAGPLEQFAVAQRCTADRHRAGVRHQRDLRGGLVDALGVDAPQPQLGRLRQGDAGEPDVRAGRGDLAEAGLANANAQPGDVEKGLDDGGWLPEAVDELGPRLLNLSHGYRRRQAAIHLEPQPLTRHVVVREVRGDR